MMRVVYSVIPVIYWTLNFTPDLRFCQITFFANTINSFFIHVPNLAAIAHGWQLDRDPTVWSDIRETNVFTKKAFEIYKSNGSERLAAFKLLFKFNLRMRPWFRGTLPRKK